MNVKMLLISSLLVFDDFLILKIGKIPIRKGRVRRGTLRRFANPYAAVSYKRHAGSVASAARIRISTPGASSCCSFCPCSNGSTDEHSAPDGNRQRTQRSHRAHLHWEGRPSGHYQSRDTYTHGRHQTDDSIRRVDAVSWVRIRDQRTDVHQPVPMDMTDGDIRYSETTREEWSPNGLTDRRSVLIPDALTDTVTLTERRDG